MPPQVTTIPVEAQSEGCAHVRMLPRCPSQVKQKETDLLGVSTREHNHPGQVERGLPDCSGTLEGPVVTLNQAAPRHLRPWDGHADARGFPLCIEQRRARVRETRPVVRFNSTHPSWFAEVVNRALESYALVSGSVDVVTGASAGGCTITAL
jgi:hypothetical protein